MSRKTFHHHSRVAALLFVGASLYSCAPAPADAAKPTATSTESPGAATPVAKKEEPPKPSVTFVKPDSVKGIYVTAWTASGTKKMDQLLQLLDKTELNAMVIDVRDSGNMYWKTEIPLAKHSPSTQLAIRDGKPLMEKLKKRGVYPIARISCFRDVWVPKAVPAQGVQMADGSLWKDRSGHTWLDPYNKKNWEYIAEVVDFALDQGFPEIQLDYVRFPSEGKAATQRYPGKKTYDDPKATPSEVITAFAKHVGERVRAKGGVYSADIFGIISSGKSDQGIGQTLEQIAEPFDLVCPMVYPSHYARGEYGIANPNAQPYITIKKSLSDFKKRIPNKPIRPWLQDFSLGHKYGAGEVKAQIKAARELGYNEYLLWNASNRYTAAALAKAGTKVSAKDDAKKEPAAAQTGKSASDAKPEAAPTPKSPG